MFTWISAGGGAPIGTHDFPIGLREILENVHGPLYSLAERASAGAFGTHEWSLRLPSAIAGVLMVPAMAWLAARWLDRSVAPWAAWLTAGSPLLVWYSQEARNYSWLMLGSTVSAALLLEVRRRCDAGSVGRYLVASAATMLSNLSFGLLVPIHLRWWLAGEPATRTARRRTLLVAAAVLALVAVPWVPTLMHSLDWSRLAPRHASTPGVPELRTGATAHVAAVPFALHAFSVGYTLGPSLRELRAHLGLGVLERHAGELLASALVFGILAALGVRALARRRQLLDLLAWLVAPAAVVSYFAARNFKVFHPRYLAASVPCWLLLLAVGLTDAPVRVRRLLSAAVVALWAISLHHHYFDPEYGREDYRGALAFVAHSFQPGEQVIAVGAAEPVYFYGKGLNVRSFWLGHAREPGRVMARLQPWLGQAGGSYVVLSRTDDLDPSGNFARELDAAEPGAARWSGPGVRVWRIRPGAGVPAPRSRGGGAPAAPSRGSGSAAVRDPVPGSR